MPRNPMEGVADNAPNLSGDDPELLRDAIEYGANVKVSLGEFGDKIAKKAANNHRPLGDGEHVDWLVVPRYRHEAALSFMWFRVGDEPWDRVEIHCGPDADRSYEPDLSVYGFMGATTNEIIAMKNTVAQYAPNNLNSVVVDFLACSDYVPLNRFGWDIKATAQARISLIHGEVQQALAERATTELGRQTHLKLLKPSTDTPEVA